MKIIKILLFLTFFVSMLKANELPKVLDKMIDAYGGQKALEKLNSYTQKWKVNAILKAEKGIDIRVVKFPNFLDTKLVYENSEERRVLDEKNSFISFGKEKINPSKIKYQGMKLQLKRLYSPLILKKLFSKILLEDYKTHYALVLEEKNEKLVYFVDKKSFLITQVTGIIYLQNQKVVFTTLYTKFKKIEGVLLPAKEYKSANSIQTAILELESMSF